MYIVSHDIIGIVEPWNKNASDFTNSIHDTTIYTIEGTRRSRYDRCSGDIAVIVKNSVREGISKLNKTFNRTIFLKMDKLFNLERNIVLILRYLPPVGSFVYGNNEQSSIELLQIELLDKIGNNDMGMLMNILCGNDMDYIEEEDKYIHVNNMSMNQLIIFNKLVNNYARPLVTIWTNFNVHILNWRNYDHEQSEYTCNIYAYKFS